VTLPATATARAPQRLSPGAVAGWLLKTALDPPVIVPGWAPGAPARLTRCLRASYRVSLLAAGQPCVLWRSGRAGPGVVAAGLVVGAADIGVDGSPVVEVMLHLLHEPVPRVELVADPAFATAEIVRMPAGSNPAPLTPGELQAVRTRLGPDDLRAAGW